MVIADRKSFLFGLVLALGFVAVLAVMFSPVFQGMNAFAAADQLFNSIAKGSSDCFEELEQLAATLADSQVETSLTFKDGEMARSCGTLLEQAGLRVSQEGSDVSFSGGLTPLLRTVIDDSRDLFRGEGQSVADRYGLPERVALYSWWTLLKELGRDLKHKGKFKEAAAIERVISKGVEVGYNFHGIAPRRAADNWLILTLALVFYIFYTLWWGYAILLLFEGLGLQMKAHAKKEV